MRKVKSYALLFTTLHPSSPLHLRITHGIETEARPVWSGGLKPLFYVPQISQIFRKRLRVKSGEEWRKLFTRASF